MGPQQMLALESPMAVATFVLAHVLAQGLTAASCALGMRRASLALRLASALMYAGGAWLLLASARTYALALLAFAVSLLYFYALACVIVRAAPRASSVLTRPALFVVCAMTCVLIPALAAPGDADVLILPFGFELMLRGYGFLLEPPPNVSRRSALFFLLVNPTLVQREMGREIGAASLSWVGTARIALGYASLCASVLAAQSFALFDRRVAPGLAGAGVLEVACRMLAGLLATYFAAYFGHSGAASVQLGWMRLLGWEVRERYRYPFLATSPLDFWRRWNTYFGAWLRRYAFEGIARGIRGLRSLRVRAPATTLAVLFTLALSGVLHDFASYAATFDLRLGASAGFVTFGVGLLAWEVVVAALRRKLGAEQSRIWLALPGAAVTLTLIGALGWLRAQPMLPRPLSELVGLYALGL